MQNILKYIFNWNMLLVFLVNILFADTVILTAHLYFFIVIISMIAREMNPVLILVALGICANIMLVRLFVLPIFYFLLGRFAKDEPTQNLLHNLRYSIKTKILILIIAPLPYMVETCIISPKVTIKSFLSINTYVYFYLSSLIGGLLGSYVVLFLYWYILDRKKKSNNTELIEGQKNE